MVVGDALDARAVGDLVGGADAVVCVLGPAAGAPADVCSRAMGVLIPAMREAGVQRLVVQTGALIGGEGLGRFYRWMSRQSSVAGMVAERREQERLVRESGLDWTLVRPPRLTDGAGGEAVRVGAGLQVGALAKVARADLARVLARAATERRWLCEAVVALQGSEADQPSDSAHPAVFA